MGLAENVEQRRDAEWVMVQVDEFAGERPAHFWECLASMALGKVPKPPSGPIKERDREANEAQTVAKAKQHSFPRGKHEGDSVDSVPTEYICWWLDQQRDPFTRLLEDYVKTTRFRERQQRGE